MKAKEFLPGMRVLYIPGVADGDKTHPACEEGTVSISNTKYVHVRFDKQVVKLGWQGTTGQACDPDDLLYLDVIVNPEVWWAEQFLNREALNEMMPQKNSERGDQSPGPV